MKRYIAGKTSKLRYRLVRLLSPNVGYSLDQLQTIKNYITKTPRPMIIAARKQFQGEQELTGVEIGVASGENSMSILRELTMSKLFLVDPYIPFEDALGHGDYSADREIAHRKLAAYQQVVWIEKTSESAVSLFEEGTVDFVYIDGDHSYKSVKQDIQLYYPIVKKGGLIGGHDYTPYYATVMNAVDEFAGESRIELHTVFPDWWFVVPPK